MTRRDALVVLGALVLAIGVSTVLYVGAVATEPGTTARATELRPARPRIFFDFRGTPPPARTIADAQDRVGPLGAIVPFQRNVSDGARDAAGFLLVILVTATTLVLANDRVVSAYRASLGGWRTQVRVLLAGFAMLGLGFSATALAWVVYLGYVATNARGGPFGVPAALQLGLAAFGVILVFLLVVLAVGFSAAAWRLGDAIFRPRALARFGSTIPAPAIALIGATLLYLVWQIPAIGPLTLLAVVAYSLGAVVSARLVGGGVDA
ncbi:MAG TPA: hypothetical protein VFC31_03785 [Candidatus Limnocylindria bacterium]|nr:hypothetical protein [Candidatus Limnocylindria bacterium]